MSTQKGWIGFDLDGTLAHYEGWKSVDHIGEPIPAMIEVLKGHLAKGDTCKIFTARIYRELQLLGLDPGCEAHRVTSESLIEEVTKVRGAITAWLKSQGLPSMDITCSKDFRMTLLYDDRCKQVETNTGRIATFTP